MPFIKPAVQFGRDAMAVVLDGQHEIAGMNGAGNGRVRGAAVFDDVGNRLAQDARGLDVRACLQRVLDIVGRRLPLGEDVGLTEARHDLGAPVAQGIDQMHRLAGQAAHRQAHLLERFASERRDAVGLTCVHDGQQLGAKVVVQVGGNALTLPFGHLLQLLFRQLRMHALHLGDALGHALLRCRGAPLCIRSRVGHLANQLQAQAQGQQRQRQREPGRGHLPQGLADGGQQHLGKQRQHGRDQQCGGQSELAGIRVVGAGLQPLAAQP
mmetsp:Transcript_5017/g.18431  ORF Transcript_5017/g.18431 Transcript_5017/m.18431 type:complete len:268 (+) Transcript_5017:1560-2363(+)